MRLKTRPLVATLARSWALPCALLCPAIALAQAGPPEDWSSVTTRIETDGSLGLAQTISPDGFDVYTIDETLGERAGSNLFHSFLHFDLGAGDKALFTASEFTDNVVSRITGDSPSKLNGTLASDISGADFYFLNPSGVFFGPDASLDVPAAFYASTADRLGFDDGESFPARLGGGTPSLLSLATPDSFGFFGTAPIGRIGVEESTLEVRAGEALALVGGDIDVSGGFIRAPNGTLSVVSVASQGEVAFDPAVSWGSMDAESFDAYGAVMLRDSSQLVSTGDPAGSISIRAGSIDLRGESELESNGLGSTGNAPVAIELRADTVTLEGGAEIVATVAGGATGAGGSIVISASEAVRLSGGDLTGESVAGIDASTFGPGDGGSITIAAPLVSVGDGTAIEAATYGSGRGGNIAITAGSVIGEAGGAIQAATLGSGRGGNIDITASELVQLSGVHPFRQSPSNVNSSTIGAGLGGSITIEAPRIEVLDGAAIVAVTTGTYGPGGGGNITLTASEEVRLSGVNRLRGQPSVVTASTFGAGDGGRVAIRAPMIRVEDGAAIQAATTGSGFGGDIAITASQEVLLSGLRTLRLPIDASTSETELKFFRAQVNATTTGAGDAGSIDIVAPTVRVENAAAILAVTQANGMGGDIVITASEEVRVSGVRVLNAEINAGAFGAGDGGSIDIAAPRVTVENGAAILATVASDATGQGGDITIRAAQLRVDDASINSSSDSTTAEAVLYDARDPDKENDDTGFAFFDLEHFLAVRGEYLRNAGVNLPADATPEEILAVAREFPLLPPTATIEEIREAAYPNTQILPGGLESLEALRGAIGGAGNIEIDVERLVLANAGNIQSGTSDGPGGSVDIAASNSVTLSGRPQFESFIQAASDGAGNAGSVSVTTPRLYLYDGAVITAEARAVGAAGNLRLRVGQLTARGASQIRSSSTATRASLLDSYADFLAFRPEFEDLLGDPGAAGTISIDSDVVRLSGGSQISVFARAGADIPEGLGPGAPSAGNADGDIAIEVRDLLVLEGGSKIEASVESGLGGSITIGGSLVELPNPADPGRVIFQAVAPNQGVVLREGSAILAQARGEEPQPQGFGPSSLHAATADPAETLTARGGDIEMNARSVLVCPDCVINADGPTSSSGGSVVLDSPETAIESQVVPPNVSYVDASSMLMAECGRQPDGVGGRFTLARWPDLSVSAEDPLLGFSPFGGELESTPGTRPALAAYRERAREARASGEPLQAARAEANAAGVALSLGESEETRDALARARLALEQAPDTSLASPAIYLRLAYLEAVRARQDPAGRRQALLAAHSDLLRARESAERHGSRRAVAESLGQLGALYAQEGGRDEEARYVTRRALQLAEEEQAADLLARWYAQLGQLAWRNARIDDALDAYRRAVSLLGETRPEAASSGRVDLAFRQAVEPVYLALVDLLLQSSAHVATPEGRQSRLAEARQVVEQWKAAELRNYFRDSCAAELAATSRSVESVDPQAAVIYPIILPDRLELLVSRAAGIARFTVAVSAQQLQGEVTRFRKLLGKRVTDEYKTPARQLYAWLVAPYLPLLKQEALHTLVFVPGGALRTIPMAALHDGERFLMERYAVAITPSLDLLAPKRLDPHETNLLLAGLSEPVQGYRGLPAVPGELAAIEALYGGEVLLDESFDRARLESVLRNQHPGVVHLASHAEFTGDPDSSFVLTHDDRLPMEELARLMRTAGYGDEPVELLLLSACETAVGDERAALGLAGMAIRAGARSAMGSLWWVSDEATSKLVIGFYEALGTPGISKARALQQAQRALLDTVNFQHPYYWAPFLVINNWL